MGIRFLYFLCAVVRRKLPAIYRTFRRLLPRLVAVSGPRARRHGKFNLEPEITSPLWCGLSIRKLRLPEAERSRDLPREIVHEIGSTRCAGVFSEFSELVSLDFLNNRDPKFYYCYINIYGYFELRMKW